VFQIVRAAAGIDDSSRNARRGGYSERDRCHEQLTGNTTGY